MRLEYLRVGYDDVIRVLNIEKILINFPSPLNYK